MSEPSDCIVSIDYPSGWNVRLRGLLLQATYSGRLEGPMTSSRNNDRIEAFKKKAKTVFGDVPIVLDVPLRKTGRIIEGYLEYGQPVRHEELPSVCCIASLESDVRVDARGVSALLLLWFQERMPDMIEPLIVNILSGVDWDAEAVTYLRQENA